jgi:hypothetical protein
MIRFWSKDGDGVTTPNALEFAGSSVWRRAAPDRMLAASGLFTLSDPADDAIINQKVGESVHAPNDGISSSTGLSKRLAQASIRRFGIKQAPSNGGQFFSVG